jgi:hypothetical protein
VFALCFVFSSCVFVASSFCDFPSDSTSLFLLFLANKHNPTLSRIYTIVLDDRKARVAKEIGGELLRNDKSEFVPFDRDELDFGYASLGFLITSLVFCLLIGKTLGFLLFLDFFLVLSLLFLPCCVIR